MLRLNILTLLGSSIILLHRNSITSDFLSNLIKMHIPDNPKWVWKSLTVSEIKYELLRLRQMFS